MTTSTAQISCPVHYVEDDSIRIASPSMRWHVRNNKHPMRNVQRKLQRNKQQDLLDHLPHLVLVDQEANRIRRTMHGRVNIRSFKMPSNMPNRWLPHRKRVSRSHLFHPHHDPRILTMYPALTVVDASINRQPNDIFRHVRIPSINPSRSPPYVAMVHRHPNHHRWEVWLHRDRE